MSAISDPGLRFLLDLTAAEGGLWEERTGVATCLLPPGLAGPLHLPEQVDLTADPAAAREDGALLVTPGHPLVETAALRVLGAGDTGMLHVPFPPGATPPLPELVDLIRAAVGVDHGRIDPVGDPPVPVRLPLLRAAALVGYDVSFDDRFEERMEVWIDALNSSEAPAWLVESADGRAGPHADGRPIVAHDLPGAAATAQRLAEARAASRLADLSRQRRVAADQAEEARRAERYYAEALASIESRRALAAADRRAVLDGQADAVRAERARRLEEIAEKFAGRFEVRPFRLHLVTVPAWSVAAVVRRGARAWPLGLWWLPLAGRPAPITCPHCGEAAPLVASKETLGCRRCLPHAALAPITPGPAPRSPASAAAPATAPAPAAATAAPPGAAPASPASAASRSASRRPSGAAAGPSRAQLERAGDRLAVQLWRGMVTGRRWPRRAVAAGSPLGVLFRLYGQAAPFLAVGLPPGAYLPLDRIETSTGRATAIRAVETRGLLHSDLLPIPPIPFTLRWRWDGARAVPGELLPFHLGRDGELPSRAELAQLCPPSLVDPPPSRLALSEADAAVWEKGVSAGGIPVAARHLAAWWALGRRSTDLADWWV